MPKLSVEETTEFLSTPGIVKVFSVVLLPLFAGMLLLSPWTPAPAVSPDEGSKVSLLVNTMKMY